MTWTYSLSTLASTPKDQVRLAIGDTGGPNPLTGSAHACPMLAASASRTRKTTRTIQTSLIRNSRLACSIAIFPLANWRSRLQLAKPTRINSCVQDREFYLLPHRVVLSRGNPARGRTGRILQSRDGGASIFGSPRLGSMPKHRSKAHWRRRASRRRAWPRPVEYLSSSKRGSEWKHYLA
jgi:hypothetical protein